MNNKKILAVILSVLAIVCVFAALAFSGIINFDKTKNEESTAPEGNYSQSDAYKNDMKASIESDSPYLETNIDGLYYTMSKDGSVGFYKLENNAFVSVEPTGTYTASVNMSEEDISADITYYNDNGKIAGYGLYTGESGKFNLYPYAFFRLTNYGGEFDGRSSKSCLLLVDTTEDDFYSNSKVFEESFIFTYSNSSASRTLSEESRTVGINGAKRQDYFMFNDCVIDNSTNHYLFFSGRQYSEEDERVDLYRSGGSGNNTDNIRLAHDVIGYWIGDSEDDIMYVSVDENENVIVNKFDRDSEDYETVKTFEGVKREDILVDNGYIYIIGSNTVYSILSDTEIKLAYNSASSFKADMFKANGDTFIVRGYLDSYLPAVISAKTADGSVIKAYVNDIFRNIVNPIITDGGNILFSAENNGKFTTYIF